ncbi:MAG: PTS sugar transporter subunit IIA [Planctomycetota bacterium]
MDFPDHLLPASILLAPPVADKWELLHAMVEATADSWEMSPEIRQSCHERVLAREQSASTGMEAGIAVPHAAVDGLAKMVVSMAILPTGLDFASLDALPAKVVVMILVPKHEKLVHLHTLTEVARRLGDGDFRNTLLEARSSDEVVRLWS